jgi:hypothetical protein
MNTNFSLEIVSKRNKIINNCNYRIVKSGTIYQVKLQNNTYNKTSVVLYINKIRVGAFEIDPNSYIVVSRPVYKRQEFTFTRNSIIDAFFLPEKTIPVTWSIPKPMSCCIVDNDIESNYDDYLLVNSDKKNSKENKDSKVHMKLILLDQTHFQKINQQNNKKECLIQNAKNRHVDDFFYLTKVLPY